MATIKFIDYLVKWNKLTHVMFCSMVAGKKLDVFFSARKAQDVRWEEVGGVAHSTPTDQKPSTAPIFVHSSTGVWHLKEKPAGGGWGIPNKRRMGGCGTGAR